MTQLAEVPPVYASGEGKRFAVWRLLGVKSGDTFDVKSELYRVDHVKCYSPSSMKTTEIVATVEGTMVTITGVDLADDVIYLSVGGSAAT